MHNQIISEYPPELLSDQDRLAALVVELVNRFGNDIAIHIIDPQSLPGIFKALRYRVRKYPAFIIDGQELVVGWNPTALERALMFHSIGYESPSGGM